MCTIAPEVSPTVYMYILYHSCACRLEQDELSDDEVWDSGEEDSGDESGDKAVKRTISATKAATLGGASTRMRGRAKTIDSTLKPMSRLHLYDHQTWRMEVGGVGHDVLKYYIYIHVCTRIMCMYDGYLQVRVHEVHGRMHPNYCQITISLYTCSCSN